MTAALDCPDPASWRALFDGALPPEDRERYERHLESCRACQEHLDRDGPCEEAVRQLVRRVGGATAAPPDPALSRFLRRLNEGVSGDRAHPGEPADLYFLRPADRPDTLGLLGKYEVREVIGQGGMGVVLRAFEPALNRLVAIKVLAPALAGSATARRRFTREARAAAAVCHDHVVAVHGVEEVDGLPYLVMHYVAGESLQQRLDRAGPLPVEEVVRVGLEAASGLAAAHARGLIHRDVKPANLLLEGDLARVKVTDFGLARMADDAGLTQAGMVAGTPEYMAPEQARGEAVDHRADQYGLGAALYACCTGRPPFPGDAPVAVLRQVSEKEPASVRTLNPGVPGWLDAFIARLLAKDPARRFRGAAEAAALLEGYLAHLRQPAAVPAPGLPSHPVPPTGPGDTEMSFPCSGCGAALKVRTELAGKKVKCPRCGTALVVPAAAPAPRRKGRALAWGAGLLASLGLVLVLLRAWFSAPLGPTAAPSFLEVTLGNRSVPGVEDSGFYNDEQNEGGPFRWTNGRGTLVIPLDRKEPPQALHVRLRRPKGTSLQILVNDRELIHEGTTRRDMSRWERTLDLDGVDLGNRVVVEVVSNTVIPHDVDPKQTEDTRALGVQVGGITLLRLPPGDRAPPATPSLLNVIPGEPSGSGVEDSGFYAEERDGEGPFLWTDGMGRLVIPIDKKDPPQALRVRLDRPTDRYLKITLNDREVVNEPADERAPRRWERTFDLSGLELGEALVVEIVSNTTVTRTTPRAIGVQVRAVQLLRAGGGNRRPSGTGPSAS
jgi:serine/threonine protein kinase